MSSYYVTKPTHRVEESGGLYQVLPIISKEPMYKVQMYDNDTQLNNFRTDANQLGLAGMEVVATSKEMAVLIAKKHGL